MTMLEELARAICEADHHNPWPDDSYNGRTQRRHYEKLTRAVLTCLLDDPTMSRETRRHLEAILSEGTDNGLPMTKEALEASQAVDSQKIRDAADEVVMRAFDQYRARNGKMSSIEGDDGEKCWIVPFDAMDDLRAALSTPTRIEASQPQEAVFRAGFLAGYQFIEGTSAPAPNPVEVNRAWVRHSDTLTPPQAAESGLLDEAIAALRVARMWSDDDWVGREIVDKVLAKAGKPGEAGNG